MIIRHRFDPFGRSSNRTQYDRPEHECTCAHLTRKKERKMLCTYVQKNNNKLTCPMIDYAIALTAGGRRCITPYDHHRTRRAGQTNFEPIGGRDRDRSSDGDFNGTRRYSGLVEYITYALTYITNSPHVYSRRVRSVESIWRLSFFGSKIIQSIRCSV